MKEETVRRINLRVTRKREGRRKIEDDGASKILWRIK
jgi:hypothetical protein